MLRRLVHMHYRWLELSAAISEARILPHGRRRPRLVEERVPTTSVAQRGDNLGNRRGALHNSSTIISENRYSIYISRFCESLVPRISIHATGRRRSAARATDTPKGRRLL